MRLFTAVVNPAAGGGGRTRGRGRGLGSALAGTATGSMAVLLPLAKLLREAGAEVTVEYSNDLAHAGELARAAAERGHMVLAAGGDGMAGAVGGALAETDATLGIVPAGRGNDFARQLGLPSAPAELAALLLDGEPRPVDTIRANDTVVLGSVYMGVDAVAGRNANASRWLRGSAAYYVGALRAVAAWRPTAYRVSVDGERHDVRGYTVIAANSGFYGFGRHVAPDARVDDGLLDVVLIRHAPKAIFFAVMRELERGTHVRRPQVEVLRGRSVHVEADRSLPYGADGETLAHLPVTAEVMPGALHVLRP